MSEHTPGPWVVKEYENVRAARADGEFSWANPDSVLGDCFHGQPVGTVWQTVDGAQTGLPGNIEVSLANARLIAAAPDLLAAAKLAWDRLASVECRCPDDGSTTCRRCLAGDALDVAINKAAGR